MVGFWIAPEVARELAVAGGEKPEDLHLTLAFFGKASELGDDALETLRAACSDFARTQPPIDGRVSGIGRFRGDGGTEVLHATVDFPALGDLRAALRSRLRAAGVAPLDGHGFDPHLTLAYLEAGSETTHSMPAPHALRFDRLVVAVRGQRDAYRLGGGPPGVNWRCSG